MPQLELSSKSDSARDGAKGMDSAVEGKPIHTSNYYRVLDGLDEDGHLRCGKHYVSAASSTWSSTANTATTTALVERTLWPQGHLLVLTSLQRTLSSCGP